MAKRRKSNGGLFSKLGGLVALIGLGALIYGGISYFNLQDALGNKLTKVIAGTTEAEKQALFFIIAGGVALIAGLGLFVKGRR